MSDILVGIIGVVIFFGLLVIRMPVATAMFLVGTVGIFVLDGSIGPALATMALETFEFSSTHSLLVIPLFILMGNLASVSGMSRDLYAAAYAWVGQMRGGLASATVVGCAGFAALSGSSVASAVTMGRVALPEMERYGYSPRLATGAVAAGGTLGILIPPSTGFVIYAILTERSIGKLFLAGVFPGLLLAALFVVTIIIQTSLKPELGPPRERRPDEWRERGMSLIRACPIVFIVLVTIGGIYGGAFTPVEASGVGAVMALMFALAMTFTIKERGLTAERSKTVLLQTVRTTAMSMLIIIGAHIFSPFLARTGIPEGLAGALVTIDVGPVLILAVLMLAFILLGTFLEGFAILVLAVPIVLPIVTSIDSGLPQLLGFADASCLTDPDFADDRSACVARDQMEIWFGVVMVIVLEMGLISPPVGVNVFVVKGIAEHVPMREIFIGILPFWAAMAVCLAILCFFPGIALYLPETMTAAR